MKISFFKNSRRGFSVVEVLLAAALFMVLAAGAIPVILQGLDSNRLGEEQTVATQYASEGIEALRSIRNQAFVNLVNSSGTGIIQSAGVWILSGVNNQFSSNKYTRVLKVEDVQRDVSGNIVSSGGTLDSLSKKITSTVTWNFSPTRVNSVVLVNYLTDWKKAILAAGGLIVYGDGTTTPKYRTYNTTTNTFGAQTSTVTSSSGVTFIVRTSPTKTEAIAGFVTAAGVLNIQCFDGVNWTQEWNVTVGGTGTTRRFDIAYETNSGDVMVFYGTNTATTNELAYRTKLGSSGCGAANWAGAVNFDPVRTSGIASYIKLAWDRRAAQNLIAATWVDTNDDISGAIWSGTAWGNEPATVSDIAVERISVSHDLENMDIEYESLSGDVMMIWGTTVGSNANGIRYRLCTGGTSACTWGAVTTPPTWTDDGTNLDISANPNTDEIVFASIGRLQSDLQLGYWNGSAWTNQANSDNSSNGPSAGSKIVSTAWLISGVTTRSVIVYADQGSNSLDWYTGSGGTFTKQTDFGMAPAPSNPNRYYELQMNPLSKDQLMLNLADNLNDLLAKRLVMTAVPAFTWTNSDGAVLTATLPKNITNPFSFAYWRN